MELNTNILVFIPLTIFFIEGMIFANVMPSGVMTWINLLLTPPPAYEYPAGVIPFTNIPTAPRPIELTDWAGNIGYLIRMIIWIIREIVFLIPFFINILIIPLSVSNYIPILLIPNLFLIILFLSGIIMKISILGSGMKGE